MSPKRCSHLLLDLRAVVEPQLGVDRPGLDQRHAHVAAGDLLAQRLAERAHAVLGQVVDAAAAAGDPPGHGADVDHVGDPARPVLRRRASRCGSAAWAQYSSPWMLTAIIRSHSWSGASTAGPSSITPALLTSVSSRPSSSTVRSTSASRLLLGGDVGLDRQDRAAVGLDPRGELVEPILAPGGDRHRGALAGRA